MVSDGTGNDGGARPRRRSRARGGLGQGLGALIPDSEPIRADEAKPLDILFPDLTGQARATHPRGGSARDLLSPRVRSQKVSRETGVEADSATVPDTTAGGDDAAAQEAQAVSPESSGAQRGRQRTRGENPAATVSRETAAESRSVATPDAATGDAPVSAQEAEHASPESSGSQKERRKTRPRATADAVSRETTAADEGEPADATQPSTSVAWAADAGFGSSDGSQSDASASARETAQAAEAGEGEWSGKTREGEASGPVSKDGVPDGADTSSGAGPSETERRDRDGSSEEASVLDGVSRETGTENEEDLVAGRTLHRSTKAIGELGAEAGAAGTADVSRETAETSPSKGSAGRKAEAGQTGFVGQSNDAGSRSDKGRDPRSHDKNRKNRKPLASKAVRAETSPKATNHVDKKGKKSRGKRSRQGEARAGVGEWGAKRGTVERHLVDEDMIAGTGMFEDDSADSREAGPWEVITSRSGAISAAQPGGARNSTENSAPGATVSGPLASVPGVTFGQVAPEWIIPNLKQPRQVFDEDELDDLAASLSEVGVLQPVVVRRITAESLGEEGQAERLEEALRERPEARYELIMGERRWRAAQRAGLSTIPIIVRDTTEDELLREALIENIHRVQLNALEEAAAYQQLMEDFGYSQEQLSKRVSKSRSQVANLLRLLRLPGSIQRMLASGVITPGHARALLSLESESRMRALADRIVSEGISVRATEELVRSRAAEPEKARRRPQAKASVEALRIADEMAEILSTTVKVTQGAHKGKVVIEFADGSDLQRIFRQFQSGADQTY